jgi:ligand-binding SRPBCC domain-containing protein
MHTYILEREQIIHRSRAETFAFFSDAFNLERITPPFLKFHIVTPRPIKMSEGAVIDYELSLYGLRFRWRTLIEEWSPEERFVDSQLKGPYSSWRHTHTFEEIAPDRTLVRDRVLYRLPFGLIGRLAHWLFVRRSLEEIFDYRAKMIEELLWANEEEAKPEQTTLEQPIHHGLSQMRRISADNP